MPRAAGTLPVDRVDRFAYRGCTSGTGAFVSDGRFQPWCRARSSVSSRAVGRGGSSAQDASVQPLCWSVERPWMLCSRVAGLVRSATRHEAPSHQYFCRTARTPAHRTAPSARRDRAESTPSHLSTPLAALTVATERLHAVPLDNKGQGPLSYRHCTRSERGPAGHLAGGDTKRRGLSDGSDDVPISTDALGDCPGP